MSDEPRRADLAWWKDMTAHGVALILTLGFFGIAFLALTGWVAITDPTTANFVGTVTGYAIGQLSRPLAFYFGGDREATGRHANDSAAR